jgi:hypothetical protein
MANPDNFFIVISCGLAIVSNFVPDVSHPRWGSLGRLVGASLGNAVF